MSLTPLSAPGKPRTKPPSLLACIPCRRSHVKCNGNKPVCSRCEDRRSECVWIESRRGYRDSRKTTGASNHDAPVASLSSSVSGESTSEQPEQYDSPTSLPPLSNASTSPASQLDSISAVTRERSWSSNPRALSTNSDDLIDAFYQNFYPAHPFVLPRKRYLENPAVLPEYLKAVMRYTACHFKPHPNHDALANAANIIFTAEIPEDGFKVQALLMMAVTCFARHDNQRGVLSHGGAIELSLRLGMNTAAFAIAHGQKDPILEESWRRTWWMLWIIDGIASAVLNFEAPFRFQLVACDVPLPGPCETYNDCRVGSSLRTLDDMRYRALSEDTYEWSSFAYAVEAMRIMVSVFELGQDVFNITDSQVEAVDTSIASFFLSLPADKREVVERDGTVDELLVTAHMIINWTSIDLHRPRSTLTFIKNHYRTVCTKVQAVGFPTLSYSSHTSKTLRAANEILNLIAIRRPLAQCTPCMVCALGMAATVHLPAFAIADKPADQAAVKERVQLIVSALGSFAEVWPRAQLVRSQIAQFAREVFGKATTSTLAVQPPQLPQQQVPQLPVASTQKALDIGPGYSYDPWMNNFMQSEFESCGVTMDSGVFSSFGLNSNIIDPNQIIAADIG